MDRIVGHEIEIRYKKPKACSSFGSARGKFIIYTKTDFTAFPYIFSLYSIAGW